MTRPSGFILRFPFWPPNRNNRQTGARHRIGGTSDTPRIVTPGTCAGLALPPTRGFR
jgi:hypothetical protein